MKNNFFYFMLLCLVSAGCDTSGPEVISETALPAQEGTKGTLLAVVQPSRNYTIQFLELEPGTVGIKTIFSNGEKIVSSADIDALTGQGKSFVEVYKHLAQGQVSSTQLKAVEAAYQRFLHHSSALDFDDAENNIVEPNGRIGVILSDNPFIPDREDCAPDHYQDRYGDAWFRETYNLWSSARTNQHDASYERTAFEVTFWAMAADFETGALFKTYSKNSNGSWRTWADEYMQPRAVHSYHFWSNKKHVFRADAIGLSPCARVHLGYSGERR